MANGERIWTVYLAGEIHSDWRERIAGGVERADLPVVLTGPVSDHGASDDCGVEILGPEDEKFWHDHKGAGVNAVRTYTLLREADIVVVRFGEQYKQWNAAFDAGQAAALGTPLITRQMLGFAARHNIEAISGEFDFRDINAAFAHLQTIVNCLPRA